MKLRTALFAMCCLLCLEVRPTLASPPLTVKGLVITSDGTEIPEFSVVWRYSTDKPQLISRKHFKNGEFSLEGLEANKYQLQISAPLFIPTKVILDFKTRPPHGTDYRIVVLHSFRNELRLAPGAAYSVSTKVSQQNIPAKAMDAYLRGVTLHKEGKLEEALIEYGTALRKYPRYLDALTDAATIVLLYNRPESALSFLLRAQSIDDSNPIINLNIAVALTEQGDYNGALKLLKNILGSEPRIAVAQVASAKIYYLQK